MQVIPYKVWDPHQVGLIHSLERIQIFALRMCTENGALSTIYCLNPVISHPLQSELRQLTSETLFLVPTDKLSHNFSWYTTCAKTIAQPQEFQSSSTYKYICNQLFTLVRISSPSFYTPSHCVTNYQTQCIIVAKTLPSFKPRLSTFFNSVNMFLYMCYYYYYYCFSVHIS